MHFTPNTINGQVPSVLLAQRAHLEELISPAAEPIIESDEREAWLAARKLGIGASECAAALGLDPWRSAVQLYAEKTGEVLRDRADTDAMVLGRRFQAGILEEFSARTEIEAFPADILYRSRRYPWMLATPDGLAAPGGELAVIEGKLVGPRVSRDWVDGAPLHVQAQVAQQCIVLGASGGWIAAAITDHQRMRFELYAFELTGAIERMVIEGTGELWRRVQARQVPAVDNALAVHAISQIYPADAGRIVDLPEEALDWDRDRTEAIELLKAAEERRDLANARLQAAIGDASWGLLPGGAGKYSWKLCKRDGYWAKPSEYRRFIRHN